MKRRGFIKGLLAAGFAPYAQSRVFVHGKARDREIVSLLRAGERTEVPDLYFKILKFYKDAPLIDDHKNYYARQLTAYFMEDAIPSYVESLIASVTSLEFHAFMEEVEGPVFYEEDVRPTLYTILTSTEDLLANSKIYAFLNHHLMDFFQHNDADISSILGKAQFPIQHKEALMDAVRDHSLSTNQSDYFQLSLVYTAARLIGRGKEYLELEIPYY